MRSYDLSQAAALCGVSVKALRRRAERGTLRVVVRDGVRRVPESELERAGLLPGAEIRSLRAELERLERELGQHRLLAKRAEHVVAAETEARERAQVDAAQARAAERQAQLQLRELATMGWRQRRRRLRELRAQ